MFGFFKKDKAVEVEVPTQVPAHIGIITLLFLIEAKSHMTWLRKSNSCYTLRKSLQTTSALSATSKQCFEQPAASFLVCSLIFIEY